MSLSKEDMWDEGTQLTRFSREPSSAEHQSKFRWVLTLTERLGRWASFNSVRLTRSQTAALISLGAIIFWLVYGDARLTFVAVGVGAIFILLQGYVDAQPRSAHEMPSVNSAVGEVAVAELGSSAAGYVKSALVTGQGVGVGASDHLLDERLRVLTAFSHDVQTPITRMRLRLELADDFPEQQKLLCDLREAEQLIRDGIAYAKNAHLCAETATPVDLRAFVESLVFDYQDTGRPVTTAGKIDGVIMLKPIALRRILSNFVDNALKYAGSAEVSVCRSQTGSIVIAVLDNGPGIACDKLESVKQPFVRLERDHFDGNGGTGLGLAIADQLANDMNAKLQLLNRSEGGLSAQIVFGLRTVSNVERLSTRVSAHCDVSRSASDMR